LSPADRVAVDWRISEYELVDDNEASHVDKLKVGGHLAPFCIHRMNRVNSQWFAMMTTL